VLEAVKLAREAAAAAGKMPEVTGKDLELAEQAFGDYEFGAGVDYVDSDEWVSTRSGSEMSKKAWFETESEDDGPNPRYELTFTVRIDRATGLVVEATAIDHKGQIWGHLPSSPLQNADGKVPQVRFEQPIGHTVGGFTVGHLAKMKNRTAVGTIVEVVEGEVGPEITLEFAEPQPTDLPGEMARRFQIGFDNIASTWMPGAADAEKAGKLRGLTELAVEDLQAGDEVDLSSCPFLNEHASAEFEFAVVESVERETSECVAVSYEDHDVVGYPVGYKLKVSSETIGNRNLPKEYLVFSRSEAEATTIREGFWSNKNGWGDFRSATRFTVAERDAFTLPVSAGSDARWVDADELAPFFKEQEQRAKLARAEQVLFEQAGIRNPVAAKQFFAELLDSVETLSGIADQHGSRTLADLMFLQNAIASGGFIDHYPDESSVGEVVKLLPSADRWMKYVSVQEPESTFKAPSPSPM
jgi:hypothetical protein